MRYPLVILLMLTGCTGISFGTNPSGLTQKQAEQKLAEYGFSEPSIGPSPEGWTGRAVRFKGYEVGVTVGKNGVVTTKPLS